MNYQLTGYQNTRNKAAEYTTYNITTRRQNIHIDNIYLVYNRDEESSKYFPGGGWGSGELKDREICISHLREGEMWCPLLKFVLEQNIFYRLILNK